MPERGFDTAFWGDTFIEDLDPLAKLLYIYLWTNEHCNQSGLYQISLKVISNETGLLKTDIPGLLEILAPKIKWYQENNLIWVKNFLKRQSKSSKFLQAAAKCLVNISDSKIVDEVLSYNQNKYSISIPYQYYMNNVSILTRALSCSSSVSSSSSNSDKGVKEKGLEKTIEGNPEDSDDLSLKEQTEDVTSIPAKADYSAATAEIFSSYEENIGRMTPIIADELKDMLKQYPPEWFKPAYTEACKANARSMRYIQSILKRWGEDGHMSSLPSGGKSGTNQRYPQETTAERLRASLGKPLG